LHAFCKTCTSIEGPISMSDRNFSRRRRGMRFRPSGGMGANVKRAERAAHEARAEAVGGKPTAEQVYDRARFEKEIERAENIAAGLPPEGVARKRVPRRENGPTANK